MTIQALKIWIVYIEGNTTDKNEQTRIPYNVAYTGNMGGGDTTLSNKPEPDWSGK